MVFLALRGEEGHAECAWPIPLDVPAERGKPGIQLRLIEDDGYAGPGSLDGLHGAGLTEPSRVRRLRTA